MIVKEQKVIIVEIEAKVLKIVWCLPTNFKLREIHEIRPLVENEYFKGCLLKPRFKLPDFQRLADGRFQYSVKIPRKKSQNGLSCAV